MNLANLKNDFVECITGVSISNGKAAVCIHIYATPLIYAWSRTMVSQDPSHNQRSQATAHCESRSQPNFLQQRWQKSILINMQQTPNLKSNAYTIQSLPNLFAIKVPESVSSSTDKCWRLDSLWEKKQKIQLNNFYAKYFFNRLSRTLSM